MGPEIKQGIDNLALEKVYSKVQFIGMSICTTPGSLKSIEDMSDEGVYLGYEDVEKDISGRINLLNTSIRKAKASNHVDSDAGTLKIFVVPEFYFRGNRGAYHLDKMPPEVFFSKYFAPFQKAAKSYPDWLFVLGTVVTSSSKVDPTKEPTKGLYHTGDSLLDVYHKMYPDFKDVLGVKDARSLRTMLKNLDEEGDAANCDVLSAVGSDAAFQDVLRRTLDNCDGLAGIEVNNHCYVVSGGTNSGSLSVLKQFKSKEDFILNSIENNYTQTITKYKPIPSAASEIKDDLHDPYSIFKHGNLWIGLEICLDHSRKRLFQRLLHDRHHDYVDVQIVTSCGMSVRPGAVTACKGCYVFNCDGEYVLKDNEGTNGIHSHTTLQEVATAIEPKTPENASPEAKLNPPRKCGEIIALKCPSELYRDTDYQLHIYPPVNAKRAGTEK